MPIKHRAPQQQAPKLKVARTPALAAYLALRRGPMRYTAQEALATVRGNAARNALVIHADILAHSMPDRRIERAMQAAIQHYNQYCDCYPYPARMAWREIYAAHREGMGEGEGL
jgi:hypothetical protein